MSIVGKIYVRILIINISCAKYNEVHLNVAAIFSIWSSHLQHWAIVIGKKLSLNRNLKS